MSEPQANYVVTGLELANLTLRVLDNQAVFRIKTRGISETERSRLVAEAKRLEAALLEMATSLESSDGDTGAFAFLVKRMCLAQQEFFKERKRQGSDKTISTKTLDKVKNLEASAREDAMKIVNAAILFQTAIQMGGRVVSPAGNDDGPVHKERRGKWEQAGF